jgi:phage terminase large subunit
VKTIQGTKAGKLTAQVLLNSSKRYIVHEGGARSGKTYGIVQVLIQVASSTTMGITISSHSLPHLKRGAMRDFMSIMNEWGWYSEEDHNKTDNVYHFDSGGYIEFLGLEEANKARGAGRDILFVNEANLVGKQLFDQLDMRTKGKVILDLNPSDFDCYCYEIADGANAVKVHSTYQDNPYLPKQQVEIIESYKNADPLMWQVFGLGLRGTSQDQIFTHWKVVDQLPGKGKVYYGLDFGYNVPSALVKIETYEECNYVQEVIYETKLTTGDLIERLKLTDLKRSDAVYCDNAEPKTIEEIYRAGFNAKPAEKDVYAGIQKVKSMPLFVTRESKNLISELKSYKWKLDKEGKVHPDEQPEKEKDHAIDAMRYGIFTHAGAFKFKVVVA